MVRWERDSSGRLASNGDEPPVNEVLPGVDVGGHLYNRMALQGPANFVDPTTYRRIRADARRPLMKKLKRKSSTKKKSSRKRSYSRSSGSGTYRNGGLNGMGPIVITGRGGYFTDKLKAGLSAGWKGFTRGLPEGTWNRIGSAAGGAMFGGTGAEVGGALGKQVAKMTGFGDYAISYNSLMMPEGSPVPAFGNMSQATIIRHREYIKDISGPTVGATFTLDSFPINPGNPKTFPWLSQIAANYDQYALLGCVFEYKSTSTDFSSGAAIGTGTVILATDYDSADALYSSKIEMENSQFCITSKPQQDALHPIECDPSVGFNEIKYLRGIAVPTGKDQRLYDHGTFEIATQGLPNSAGSIGELWVTYEVALYKPQFLVQGQGSITDMFTLVAGRDNTNTLTPSSLVQTADVGSSIGGTIQTNTYTFPTYIQSGRYMIMFGSRGTATTLTNIVTWSVTNCTATSVWANDTLDTWSPYPAGTLASTAASSLLCVTVTGSGATVTIAGATLPGPITSGNFFVMSIDKNA